jgi:3-hydroxyacyl-[acyl-carrier-protein] dehydratase
MEVTINEIMSILPHRYPFLLIDKVIEYRLNDSIIAIKNVTINEPQFSGHFPTHPIMPGVMLVEAMAQLAAILIAKSHNFNKDETDVFLLSIEEAKFRKLVEPGDTLKIHVKIEHSRKTVCKFFGQIYVDSIIVAESKFTAMIKNR